MKYHKIIISILMSILIWRIVCITIIEISLFNFILIEIVIAIGEFFTKFGLAKAEGKPTDFKTKEDILHPSNKAGE